MTVSLTPLKLVVAGGFGVGKTTLVGAVSEIPPLTTEETLTVASAGTDRLAGVEGKVTTTVSMDFGRVTLREQGLLLLLFGTPGQQRFWFTWEELTRGAVGAVVLADTRRLADSFAPIEYFEVRGVPFVVAVNLFDGAHRYEEREIRDALRLSDHIPLLTCDARRPGSALEVLIQLTRHALSLSALPSGHRHRLPARS